MIAIPEITVWGSLYLKGEHYKTKKNYLNNRMDTYHGGNPYSVDPRTGMWCEAAV